MKKIYLGMALKGTPDWWNVSFQHDVRKALEVFTNYEVTKFVGLTGAEPLEIYQTDIKLAKSADLMVALTRFPSLGLGMEIQARVNDNKPTIVFHPRGQKLSGMVLGAPGVEVYYYDIAVEQDGPDQARQIVATLQTVL